MKQADPPCLLKMTARGGALQPTHTCIRLSSDCNDNELLVNNFSDGQATNRLEVDWSMSLTSMVVSSSHCRGHVLGVLVIVLPTLKPVKHCKLATSAVHL